MSEEVWHRARLVAELRSESSDTIALLQLDAGHSRVLTGTAATIWKLIDGNRSQAQIVAELSETFDAPVGLISAGSWSFSRFFAAEEPYQFCCEGRRLG